MGKNKKQKLQEDVEIATSFHAVDNQGQGVTAIVEQMGKLAIVKNEEEEEKKLSVKHIYSESFAKRFPKVKRPSSFEGFVDPMCFIEVETSHKDPREAFLLEIAVYLVSGDMEIMAKVGEFTIQNDLTEMAMTEDMTLRHQQSGLLAKVIDPNIAVDVKDAEWFLINQMIEYGIWEGSVPSAGFHTYNDRVVLLNHMPLLNKFLNFTIIDISSIDEVGSRWNKGVVKRQGFVESSIVTTEGGCAADQMVQRAIRRLYFYKVHMFKLKESKSKQQLTYADMKQFKEYHQKGSKPSQKKAAVIEVFGVQNEVLEPLKKVELMIQQQKALNKKK